MHWYIVKTQPNREKSVKDTIERKIKEQGMQASFGAILIPMKDKVKLLPGYILAQIDISEDMIYLFRRTGSDFMNGNSLPIPMEQKDIDRWVTPEKIVLPASCIKPPKPHPKIKVGQQVTIKDGTFSGMTGYVKENIGSIVVELSILGRSTPVELESHQVVPA